MSKLEVWNKVVILVLPCFYRLCSQKQNSFLFTFSKFSLPNTFNCKFSQGKIKQFKTNFRCKCLFSIFDFQFPCSFSFSFDNGNRRCFHKPNTVGANEIQHMLNFSISLLLQSYDENYSYSTSRNVSA